jgi:hypothetical protein
MKPSPDLLLFVRLLLLTINRAKIIIVDDAEPRFNQAKPRLLCRMDDCEPSRAKPSQDCCVEWMTISQA